MYRVILCALLVCAVVSVCVVVYLCSMCALLCDVVWFVSCFLCVCSERVCVFVCYVLCVVVRLVVCAVLCCVLTNKAYVWLVSNLCVMLYGLFCRVCMRLCVLFVFNVFVCFVCVLWCDDV